MHKTANLRYLRLLVGYGFKHVIKNYYIKFGFYCTK
jgi:hypothetical protein